MIIKNVKIFVLDQQEKGMKEEKDVFTIKCNHHLFGKFH